MNWKDLALTANFPAEISCEEISRSETRITLRWEKQPYDAPALCVTWKTALKDIQYEWYPLCGRDRALRTDWDAPIHTSFSTGAPVFCFYNEEGQNRLTIALSEVRLETLHSYGVHEEDGNLLCRLEVPLSMASSAVQYSVTPCVCAKRCATKRLCGKLQIGGSSIVQHPPYPYRRRRGSPCTPLGILSISRPWQRIWRKPVRLRRQTASAP